MLFRFFYSPGKYYFSYSNNKGYNYLYVGKDDTAEIATASMKTYLETE